MSVDFGPGVRLDRIIDFNDEVTRLRQARAEAPQLGPGERAAVIVVDFQVGFIGPDPASEAAIAATVRLLQLARAVEVPIFYGAMGADAMEHMDLRWGVLHDMSMFLPGRPEAQIHPDVAPHVGDSLVRKTQASCFFGNDLAEQLRSRDVDTVYVAGTSTSGCVRATAVDSASHQFRTLLVEDCCYDPRPLSRESALWDLADRYADVISLDSALAQLPRLGSPVVRPSRPLHEE